MRAKVVTTRSMLPNMAVSFFHNKTRLFLLIILLAMFVSNVSASYLFSCTWNCSEDGSIYVRDHTRNFSEIVQLVEDRNSTFLYEDPAGSGVWYLNGRIQMYSDTGVAGIDFTNQGLKKLYIADSSGGLSVGDAGILGEFQLSASGKKGGYFLMNGTEFIGWDFSENSRALGSNKPYFYCGENPDGLFDYKGYVINSSFDSFNKPRWSDAESLVMDNVSFYNISSEVVVIESANSTLTNIHVENGYGVSVTGTCNISIDGFSSQSTHDYRSPATSDPGLSINGDYITLSNFTINDTGWEGLGLSHDSSYITIKNGVIRYAGHNGFDLHGNNHVWIYNLTVENCTSNEFYITSAGTDSGEGTHHIYAYDVTAGHGQYGGDAFTIAGDDSGLEPVFDIYGQNWTVTSACNNSIKIYGNVTNVTLNNFDSGDEIAHYGLKLDATYGSPEDIKMIDSELHGNWNDAFLETSESYIANCNFSDIYYYLYSGENTIMYPLNVRVLNSSSLPVENANLTLTITTFGLGGLGEYFVNVSTDENGYPKSPINVPDYMRNASGCTYYNLNTVTAEKSGESDTSAALNPDETWYSVNSSSPNGTLITLTLDVAGVGVPVVVEDPPADTATTGSTGSGYYTLTTAPVNTTSTTDTTPPSSENTWKLMAFFGSLIFLSGATDTNPKMRSAPALILGLVLLLIALYQLGHIFPGVSLSSIDFPGITINL